MEGDRRPSQQGRCRSRRQICRFVMREAPPTSHFLPPPIQNHPQSLSSLQPGQRKRRQRGEAAWEGVDERVQVARTSHFREAIKEEREGEGGRERERRQTPPPTVTADKKFRVEPLPPLIISSPPPLQPNINDPPSPPISSNSTSLSLVFVGHLFLRRSQNDGWLRRSQEELFDEP